MPSRDNALKEALALLVADNGIARVLWALHGVCIDHAARRPLMLQNMAAANDWETVCAAVDRAHDIAARRLGYLDQPGKE